MQITTPVAIIIGAAILGGAYVYATDHKVRYENRYMVIEKDDFSRFYVVDRENKTLLSPILQQDKSLKLDTYRINL